MGVPSVEVLSNILIKAGAKRIVKDLVNHFCYHLAPCSLVQATKPLKFSEVPPTVVLLYEQVRHRATSGRGKVHGPMNHHDAE